MIFLFKPKKIHLDCFTNRYDVFHYFPIVSSQKTFPDWWKILPKSYDSTSSTMKSCVGFIDYFKYSIGLQLWSDLLINLEKNPMPQYDWEFSDGKSEITTHPTQQFEGYVDPIENQHIKLDSPWSFSCKEDLMWTTVGNIWNKEMVNKITFLNGILNFKYQSTTNINALCKYPKPGERETIYLPCGTNLLNFFPMSERPVEIHNHLVSSEEYQLFKEKNTKISFFNKYKKIKNIVEQNESKCPFGFKK